MTLFSLDWLKRLAPQPVLMAAGQLRDRVRWRKKGVGLYAFYDLAVSPPGFDLVTFLIEAELARRKSRATYVHVVIVPGPHDGFRVHTSKEQNGLNKENLRWRLRQVLAPLCWMLPSCRAVTVCASREEGRGLWRLSKGHVFPYHYSVSVPIKANLLIELVRASRQGVRIPSLSATSASLYHMQSWIEQAVGQRRVVTITLRESSYGPDRNSNLKEWGNFARGLDRKIYFPVVIRDFERALDFTPPELRGLKVFSEASWNVELRAALYQSSFLNMFVNNGPVMLATLNKRVRYIVFKMMTESYPSTTEKFIKETVGIERGDDLPWASDYQRVIWEPDDVVTIRREFDLMVARIESGEGLV